MFGFFSRTTPMPPPAPINFQLERVIESNLLLSAQLCELTHNVHRLLNKPEPVQTVLSPDTPPNKKRASPINYLTSNYPARIDQMVIGESVSFLIRDGFDPTGYRKALGAYCTKKYGPGSSKARLPRKGPLDHVTLTRLK